MNHQARIQAAVTGIVALGLASLVAAQPVPQKEGTEKCYGVAKAGQNDCAATGNHDCAGMAKLDSDPNSWIFVPVGYCERIVGASLTPKA